MAPKRKPSNSAAAPIVAAAVEKEVRRSTRLAKATVSPPAADQEPPKKKKTKTKTAAAKEEGEAEVEAKTLPIPAVKDLSPEPEPKKKQTKAKTKTKTKTAAAKEESEAEAEAKTLPIPAVKELSPEPEPKKKQTKTKAKTKTAAAKEEAEAEAEAKSLPIPAVKELSPEPDTVEGSKTIIIEHCKQCNAFKTRAIQVKDALEKDVAGVNVVVNPEKPRRGCFEIREEGGEVFVSLLDMKRPFPPLKKLDMEQLISDIIEKIQ